MIGNRLWRIAFWIGFGIAAISLVGPLGNAIVTASTWLEYPYPRAGSEGLILYETLLLKRGGNIYAPITPGSFISGPYPPVYYWLASAVVPNQLPDFSQPENVTSAFYPGRLISLLSAVLVTLILPVLVVYEGGYARYGRKAVPLAVAGGLVGSAVFFTLPQVQVWATRFRGDMLMIALTAGGLACVAWGSGDWGRWTDDRGSVMQGEEIVTQGNRSRSMRHSALLALGAVFFSLALFTKQTALAGPLAAGAYLLWRDWRAGLKWCALMSLLVIVPFGFLDLATGHWFYLKMVDYHSLPLRELTLQRLLTFGFWEDQWPLILAAVGYLIFRGIEAWRFRRGDGRAKVPLLVPLFTFASFATLPTGAVIGADHNHLLMSGLALSACAGAILAALLTESVRPLSYSTAIRVAALPALALLILYGTITSPPSGWYNPDLLPPTEEQQEQTRKIVHNVSQNPGNLFFSDDPGILALAGKETPYDDPFTMTALSLQGRWDEGRFLSMLRNGEFGLLVLSCDVTANPNSCRSDTATPGALDAIRAGYRVLFRDVFFTYAPR